MATVQKPGWQPNLRGVAPQAISNAFEYVRNTLTSFRTQQQAINTAPSVGIGNGSSANVTAPAQGTGQGPADAHTIVGWRQTTDSNGNTYYLPMFQ